MREVKFRGKRVDNGEWATGFYYEKAAPLQCIGESEIDKSFIVFAGFADWNMPRPMYEVEVDPETVGRFTELKDKNGKEIYEGDILEAFKHNETQFVHEVTHRGGVLWFGNWNWVEFRNVFRNIKVIGNKFENPELLEVQNA